MRKITHICISFILLIGTLSLAISVKDKLYGAASQSQGLGLSGFSRDNPSRRPEEKIIYVVRFGNIYLGQAKFHYAAQEELYGRLVDIVTFQTNLARFVDLEKIYADPENFLPLRIERDVSTWPVPEKIIENYNQKNFTLAITKYKGKRQEQFFIKNDSPIHNAILLPFYVRSIPLLDVGWSTVINLPKERFEVSLTSIEEVNVPAGKFKSYHFESKPKKFEIWLSADKRRIPVKIKGLGKLGYTLFMKEYRTTQGG